MLVHRLRRWPNVGPTLGGCLVRSGVRVKVHFSIKSIHDIQPGKHDTLNQCRTSVVDGGPTINKHGSMSRVAGETGRNSQEDGN